MPVAKVRGVNIFYQVIGDRGPWAALITGGRRGHDEFVPLATKLAKAGYRVVLHDRRNTGRSDVLIEGDVAEEILWLDDLHELLKQLGALPTIHRRLVGGRAHRDALLHPLPQRHPRPSADARHRRRLRGRTVCRRCTTAMFIKAAAAGRHGGGLRHRAIPGADRRQSADPRPADGDGPEALHQGDVELADQFIASTKTDGVRHDRRRSGVDLGSDRRHSRATIRPTPR